VDTILNASTSFSRVLALDTTSLRVIAASQTEVNFVADITQIASRVLSNVPITVAGRAGVWRPDESTVLITVEGPADRVNQLTADSVAVTARPSGEADAVTVRLAVRAPLGISAWATPDSVTVRRRAGA
jgi:hypothetical protein